MKLGIKIGLKSNWKSDLLATRPDFCEIWFDSRKISLYEPIFKFVREIGCQVGLHFWGALPDGTLTNLAYPDKEILNASRTLVKKTIETAAKYDALYVNIHPGGTLLTRVDFERQQFLPYTKLLSYDTTLNILRQSLEELSSFASVQGILFCVESVPYLALGHPWHGKSGRYNPVNIGEIPITELKRLLPMENVYFANDFGHTCANLTIPDREIIKSWLFRTTLEFAQNTKLIHVSYIVPPYNGTDYHGSLYFDEFKTQAALPNYSEMLELLKVFKNRSDIHALVEPESDHIGNFKFLKILVERL